MFKTVKPYNHFYRLSLQLNCQDSTGEALCLTVKNSASHFLFFISEDVQNYTRIRLFFARDKIKISNFHLFSPILPSNRAKIGLFGP
jgi:hypothetical protein